MIAHSMAFDACVHFILCLHASMSSFPTVAWAAQRDAYSIYVLFFLFIRFIMQGRRDSSKFSIIYMFIYFHAGLFVHVGG